MPEGYVKVSQSALAYLLGWAASQKVPDMVDDAVGHLESPLLGLIPDPSKWATLDNNVDGPYPEHPNELIEAGRRTQAERIIFAESRASAAEVALKGSEERCKLLFDAKNMWMERARKAEANLEEETALRRVEQRIQQQWDDEVKPKEPDKAYRPDCGCVYFTHSEHPLTESKVGEIVLWGTWDGMTAVAKRGCPDCLGSGHKLKQSNLDKAAVPLRLLVETVRERDEQHTVGGAGYRGHGLNITFQGETYREYPNAAMSVRELPEMPDKHQMVEKFQEMHKYASDLGLNEWGQNMSGIRAVLKACGLEVKE